MDEAAVSIRRAGAGDVPVFVDLSHALFQEDAGERDSFVNLNWPRQEGHAYYTKHIRSERSFVVLAERDGVGIGYLVGYVNEGSSFRPVRVAELESMYVRKGYRGQRVGRRLVEAFLEWVSQRGVERVSVTAYAANEGAVAFYQRLGFRPRNITLERGV
jgi:GNAT superfamily N-acetyltransferase